MKNKKLLTRLFALLASLVLVLALALPCFAEEIDQSTDDSVPVFIRSLNDFVSLNPVPGVRYVALFFSGDLGQVSVGYCTLESTSGGNVYFTYVGNGSQYGSTYSETLTIDTDASIDGYNYTISYFDGTEESETMSVDDIEFVLLVFVPSDLLDNQPDPTTPSSDMYSNLFNILKDAVYGSDAELTGSQEYALTLISTILTYATILLPVILVICISVWCFKRF